MNSQCCYTFFKCSKATHLTQSSSQAAHLTRMCSQAAHHCQPRLLKVVDRLEIAVHAPCQASAQSRRVHHHNHLQYQPGHRVHQRHEVSAINPFIIHSNHLQSTLFRPPRQPHVINSLTGSTKTTTCNPLIYWAHHGNHL